MHTSEILLAIPPRGSNAPIEVWDPDTAEPRWCDEWDSYRSRAGDERGLLDVLSPEQLASLGLSGLAAGRVHRVTIEVVA